MNGPPATGSGCVEEVLLRLLKTREEQDRCLQENREANNAKIRRGIAELDRGEGIPEDRADTYLQEMKARVEFGNGWTNPPRYR